MNIDNLQNKANEIRQDIIKMLLEAGSGHSAGPLGMSDVFTALYFEILNHDPKNPEWEERDRLFLSNGHICPVRYAAMAHAGYFSIEELMTLRKLGSRLQGHPERERLPGVETTSGPLGSGLAQAAGYSYAAKMDQKKLMRSSALLASFKLQYYEYAYEEYYKNYVVIQGIIMNATESFSLLERNKITTDIAKTLMLHQFKKNLLFYGWKVIEEFGGVPVFLFYCLILLSVLINLLGKDKNRCVDFACYFIGAGVLLTFSNALLVAVAEPALAGYFCYSQFILYCLAALLADRMILKSQKF